MVCSAPPLAQLAPVSPLARFVFAPLAPDQLTPAHMLVTLPGFRPPQFLHQMFLVCGLLLHLHRASLSILIIQQSCILLSLGPISPNEAPQGRQHSPGPVVHSQWAIPGQGFSSDGSPEVLGTTEEDPTKPGGRRYLQYLQFQEEDSWGPEVGGAALTPLATQSLTTASMAAATKSPTTTSTATLSPATPNKTLTTTPVPTTLLMPLRS